MNGAMAMTTKGISIKIIENQIKYGMINECKNTWLARKLLLTASIGLLKENKTIGQNVRFTFFAPIFAQKFF